MTEPLVALAVETSIRVAVLAVGVALVLTLFRIRSSRTRHTAWVAVIAAMLLMPLLVRMVPPVHVRVPGALGPLMPAPPPRLMDPRPLPAVPELETTSEPATRPSSVAPPIAPQSLSPSTVSEPLPWAGAIAVYLLGLALLLLRLLLGILHLFRIQRSSRVVMPEGGPAWESALVATPVTIGLIAPRVILPLTWREWSSETLTAVLAHERSHAARRDPLIAVLARVNLAVFWFHPLSWWLERTVATLAEHVADDAALKRVARQRYAETLLDVAAMVRRHNGRLVWQGVGVDGDGRLGQRIDRVLTGRTSPDPSRPRQVLVAAACLLVIAAVVACRQEPAPVPPLREDPELAAMLTAVAERSATFETARKMTAEQAAELEKALEQNPEDSGTRQTLLSYYAWTGQNKQPWNDNVAARRRHALWLVEHHPESDLVRQAPVTRQTDPEGYEQLRSLWLRGVAAGDVSPAIVGNAAWFFMRSDRVQAEQLLLRAEALQPDGPLPRIRDSAYYPSWSQRLAQLYTEAINGRDPNAQAWGRERLAASSDGRLLNDAGYMLAIRSRNEEQRSYGRRLIERAGRVDSASTDRSRELLRQLDPRESLQFSLSSLPEDKRQAALASAAPGEKLRLVAWFAELDYMSAEHADWAARQKPGHPAYPRDPKREQQRANETFVRSKSYAQEALVLAKSLQDAPEFPQSVIRAHITAGLHELREGHRREAVRHLLEASNAPALTVPSPEISVREHRLVNYLLKQGERESVIQYLERAAPKRVPREREEMLKAAAAIREGSMPERYQRLLASGSL